MSGMRGRLLWKVGAVILVLSVITILHSAYLYRKHTIETSREKAKTAAEIVRDTLTSYMILGTIDKRDVFLSLIEKTYGYEYIRVIRGEAVNRQFGKPKPNEVPRDPIEWEVLKTGKSKEAIVEDLNRVLYKVVIPYRADPSKGVDCLQCHKVKPGEVLGAISFAVDLTSERQKSLISFSIYGFLSLSMFLILLYIILKYFKPYEKFFIDIKRVLSRFQEGDFSARVSTELKDETRQLADTVNQVGEKLSNMLHRIRKKVSMLIGYDVLETENALKDTEKIVEELVKIANFKKAIEKDKSKNEIYNRIITVLGDYMSLDKFSIYEVDHRNRKIKKIHVDGMDSWCDPIIFENPDECRAKRTGEVVDSKEFPCVCPNFIHNEECASGSIQYYCIPVYIGGKVGNVVQIVYESEMDMFVNLLIPYIKGYLEEASPVLESKTLTELLQEQSYIDQLTGLYNRRFLEETYKNLVAQTKRRNSLLGILMIDIDFFKQVNDQYGHDVGDRVLKEIADTIKSSVREADIVIRFGGEEIMVILVDVQKGKAKEVAEKIRKAVESKVINFSGGSLRKTVSIGVCEFPTHTEHFWQCVKFADIALYKAKEEGRNRVKCFEPDMWEHKDY
jgi:diguanylate cyclase (GGDEF)-like protein